MCPSATSKVAWAAIHANGMSSCKAKFGISTPALCYNDLYKSKSTKRFICKTFWFCHGDKKWYVDGKIKSGVMPNPPVPDVWPIKMGIDLIALEVSKLEDVQWL